MALVVEGRATGLTQAAEDRLERSVVFQRKNYNLWRNRWILFNGMIQINYQLKFKFVYRRAGIVSVDAALVFVATEYWIAVKNVMMEVQLTMTVAAVPVFGKFAVTEL